MSKSWIVKLLPTNEIFLTSMAEIFAKCKHHNDDAITYASTADIEQGICNIIYSLAMIIHYWINIALIENASNEIPILGKNWLYIQWNVTVTAILALYSNIRKETSKLLMMT